MVSPAFQVFKSRYPADCIVDKIGWALLARVICHEVLPPDVDRVIALDLGDVLVFEDIANLWEEFRNFKEDHIYAAVYTHSLNHANGGVVLYHLGRMRDREFTVSVLRTAEWLAKQDGDCIHDQAIINGMSPSDLPNFEFPK